MSGSELAPFVAAVLKDQTVIHMQQEIDELMSKVSSLRENIDKQMLVQITVNISLITFNKLYIGESLSLCSSWKKWTNK
jgi:cob(I)alamin adenosyltransferase